MPKITFLPSGDTYEANENAKVLAIAIRNKVPIRYGCASCRCGTCGVRLSGSAELSGMNTNERELLTRMGLPTEGNIRLACQTKILQGDLTVDLAFQDEYSPDQMEADDDDEEEEGYGD